MPIPYADRAAEAVRRSGTPAIVGLDPHPDLLPDPYRSGSDGIPDLAGFGRRVLELVEGRVAAVKIQVAFYERWGWRGWRALEETAAEGRRRGILLIADAKRGDIRTTARAYARTFFPAFDAVTVHPYLGEDGIRPFLEEARTCAGGVFVLLRTTNPSAGEIQDLPVAASDSGEPRPLHLHLARHLVEWSAENLGSNGYGDVGAVVGATAADRIAPLRNALPGVWLLVPGYGAQGGTGPDVAAALDREGLGAFISSSRGIVFPGASTGAPPAADRWEDAMIEAIEAMRADLGRSVTHSEESGSEI